jgi:hypothetical protein
VALVMVCGVSVMANYRVDLRALMLRVSSLLSEDLLHDPSEGVCKRQRAAFSQNYML